MAKEEKTEIAKEKKTERETLLAEAEELGVTMSKMKMSGFTVRGKPPDPAALARERKRQENLVDERLKNRVEQAKLNAKLKPIEKRKNLIVSRFKAIRSNSRANTYSNKNIEAWLEELKLIESSPKSWVKLTMNGTKPYIPGNKKKKSARDILDGMDLG